MTNEGLGHQPPWITTEALLVGWVGPLQSVTCLNTLGRAMRLVSRKLDDTTPSLNNQNNSIVDDTRTSTRKHEDYVRTVFHSTFG